jgi:hypothetical protein
VRERNAMRFRLLSLAVAWTLASACSSGGSSPSPAAPSGFDALVAHKILVTVATATGKQPIHLIENQPSAFAMATENDSGTRYRHVTVRFAFGGLPIEGTLCKTNPTTGQCLAPPSAEIDVPFDAHETADFSAFITAHGSVKLGTIAVEFVSDGETLGSGKVSVTTKG